MCAESDRVVTKRVSTYRVILKSSSIIGYVLVAGNLSSAADGLWVLLFERKFSGIVKYQHWSFTG